MTKHFLLGAFAALAATAAVAQTPPADGPRGGGMMQADTNKDGVVTWAEAQAAATERFTKLDTNHDAVLTADELPAGPGGKAFQRMDGDSDGKVNAAQYVERARTRFDRLDTNHDGKIDAAEMQAMRDRMAARGQ